MVSSSSIPDVATSRLLQRLSTASHYATLSDYPTRLRILSFVGGFFVGRFVLDVGTFLWKYCVPNRRPIDYFAKRYGVGSWVVVTGATGPIGSAFCSFFADQNLNLVLIGGSASALEAKSKQIKEAHPTVMTMLIVSDFTHAAELGWVDNIVEQLQGMSISVLVNASQLEATDVSNSEADVDSVRRTLIANVFPRVLLTASLLPRFAARYQKLQLRGAIITVSSEAGKRIFPGFATYCAFRGILNSFNVAIGVEFQKAVDSLSIDLLGTTWDKHNAERCVSSSMRQLGRCRETSGWWVHSLQRSVLNMVPSDLLDFVWPKLVSSKAFPKTSEIGRR